MPLNDHTYSGSVVYNFFDNLLPDSNIIRARIQLRFGAKTDNCFDLLTYIGADCVGALQLLTSHANTVAKFSIKGTPLTEQRISELLRNYKTAPLGMERDTDFRISLAGAQEKIALLRYKKRWLLPTESTPTTHIFKLPTGIIEHSGIDLRDSIENEFICLQILKAFGLPTANAEIAHFGDLKALVVERFDRVWLDDYTRLIRIPQEDLCQAFGVSGNLKYESDGGPGIVPIMKILRGAINPDQDRYTFMHAVFLFWILGAIDGHAKNFSLILEPGGKYRLAPLYDVISAYPLVEKKNLELQNLKMAMAVHGKTKHYKWQDIILRHWFETAQICKFPREQMQEIIDHTFDELPTVLDNIHAKLTTQIPTSMFDAISNGMLKLRNQSTQPIHK